MKDNCNIVKDLLPLYVDGIASADSVAFVAAHLADCESCRGALEELKIPTDPAHDAPTPEAALPLKAVKRKWQRKKSRLILISLLAGILAACALFFAAKELVYQERITVDNAVYTQKGAIVSQLPNGSKEIGYLQGISHFSTGDPAGNCMGTNLDSKYGGCPIYQSGVDEAVIYLGGYNEYIPFLLTGQLTGSTSIP